MNIVFFSINYTKAWVMERKKDVLLRHGISLTVICEKVKFSNSVFAIIFVTLNGYTYKLFKNIFNDFLTEGI